VKTEGISMEMRQKGKQLSKKTVAYLKDVDTNPRMGRHVE